MLMAAGLGTRLKPFTDRIPKPLVPLMGIPVAQFAVDALEAAGVTQIVANVHHLPGVARSGLQSLKRASKTQLEISDESGELLGSGGGIVKARSILGDEPFFILNSDVLCEVDLLALSHAHQKLRRQWGVSLTLMLLPTPPPGETYRKILTDSNQPGLISGLGVKGPEGPFYAGVAILEPEALTHAPASGASEFVPSILEPAIASKKAGFWMGQGIWEDVGSPLLWHQTHLNLMSRLETGELPRAWRTRIESVNVREGQLAWRHKGSARSGFQAALAPYYLCAPKFSQDVALGPNAVLYGAPSKTNGSDLSNGIGWGGSWVSLSSTH